jgi:hypothetical protein
MTATDELRHLLDERGVEWETDRSGFRVMWGKPVDEFHDTMQFKAVDNALPNGGLNVHICGFTPEQAVAATLGGVRAQDSEGGEAMSGICDTCRRKHCRARWDGMKSCDFYAGGESRWHELFGTPERAARTLAGICESCKCGDCATCGVPEWSDYSHDDYDALLGWLRGDAE